jgi:nucleoside-diphosphate-sugar epimerase
VLLHGKRGVQSGEHLAGIGKIDPGERLGADDIEHADGKQRRAYTVADDEPAPADVVMEWAADRLGLGRPPEVCWTDQSVSDAMRRFYLDSKRLSNARAKAELGWRPLYPGWRDGLEAILRENAA